MRADKFEIYLIGVGGQGIGLLSETIARAVTYAGLKVNGTDTHGLAQRGGMVDATIRIGNDVHSPLLRKGKADLVIGMENHESLRGVNEYLKMSGSLVYYNVSLQPLPVRLRQAIEINEQDIIESCEKKEAKYFKAQHGELSDSRMQNVVLLATVSKNKLIPGVEKKHFESALKDLLKPAIADKNLELFNEICGH